MIENFSDIYNKYDDFLLDIWGVVHDGTNPYNGTIEMINKLILEKNVCFISNAPRPDFIIVKSLINLGINIETSKVVTSGEITRHYLNDLIKQDKTIYHLGELRNTDILKQINIKTTQNIIDADEVLLTCYLDAEEDLSQFDDILSIIAQNNIPVICANPDIEVININSFRYCAGYFAQKLEKMNVKVKYFGKPHQEIYEYVYKNKCVSQDKSRILMVGDTFETDIEGANKFGIDSALVMTGNMSTYFQKHQAFENADKFLKLEELISAKSSRPTYFIKGLF